ncbi:Lsr2 family DNA-binding protein [Dermacoccus nishinomiyaensis]|nr:hypothetical protein [Dermacoccus nishinomiyaensis]
MSGRKQSSTQASVAKRGDLNESRAKGYRVSNRGRVSANVVKAYDAAH